MTISSLFPRLFWCGIVLNYVALIPYLVFVTLGMNAAFVIRDPAKLCMHIFLVPVAMFLLMDAYVDLNLDSWPQTARRIGLSVAFVFSILCAAFAIAKAVNDFQSPNASKRAAAYPSDYYKPWCPTPAIDSGGNVTSLGDAAKTLYEVPDVILYSNGIRALKVIEGNRPPREIRFTSDAGPAGWLGPALTALAAAVGGFTVAAAALALLALYHRFELGAVKPYPKLLAAFIVLAPGFLAMQWLTSQTMWPRTPCCEPINIENVVLVLVEVVLFAICSLLIYLQIRYTKWVRVLTALALAVQMAVMTLLNSSIGVWLIKHWPWFEALIQKQKDSPIIALAVSVAITFVVGLCAALIVSPRPPAKRRRAAKPESDETL